MNTGITAGRTEDGDAPSARSDRATARTIGVLFIIGTVAGVLSFAVTGQTPSAPDVLAQVAAHRPQMALGALLVLTMGFALAMVPVVFYPVAKRYSQALAMGYVVFRGALETVMYIAISVGWLLLVALSRESASAAAPAGHWVQTGVGVLWNQMTPIPFVLGALTFYWLLFRSRLVPRWLSIWGLLGAALYMVPAIAAMFGASLGMLMAPLALQEMVMAVWLIAKGFGSISR